MGDQEPVDVQLDIPHRGIPWVPDNEAGQCLHLGDDHRFGHALVHETPNSGSNSVAPDAVKMIIHINGLLYQPLVGNTVLVLMIANTPRLSTSQNQDITVKKSNR